jgi:hypothetical protein
MNFKDEGGSMALSEPVQNGSNDLQRELLARRYSAARPVEPVLPGTDTAAPKAEEKHAFATQDWFERSSEKADGGRTALKNLIARMKALADARAEREAAERVAASAAKSTNAEPSALPTASMFVAPASTTSSGSTATGGTTTGGGTTGGSTGGGLIGKLF